MMKFIEGMRKSWQLEKNCMHIQSREVNFDYLKNIIFLDLKRDLKNDIDLVSGWSKLCNSQVKQRT